MDFRPSGHVGQSLDMRSSFAGMLARHLTSKLIQIEPLGPRGIQPKLPAMVMKAETWPKARSLWRHFLRG